MRRGRRLKEMKRTITLIALLGSLVFTSGCMSYIRWQNDRANRRAQAAYYDTVADKLKDGLPMGTWLYQQGLPPPTKKFHAPNKVWLSLFDDGEFDRLVWNRQSYLFRWTHDRGTWENLGHMVVRLTSAGETNATETVDLMTAENPFVQFDQEVRKGSQPAPARYRR